MPMIAGSNGSGGGIRTLNSRLFTAAASTLGLP